MRCIIYLFTGTGNTRIAGDFLKKHLEEQGIQTDLYQYKEPIKEVPDPNDYDLIGIGYPIHAFNVPERFLRFIKKLPNAVRQQKYFIFKVSGEPFAPNKSSSYKIYRNMKKKGYSLIMEKHYLMPYNIMFRYRDSLAKQMYEYLFALTDVMARRIAKGEEEKVKFPLSRRITSFLFRIEWIAPKVNHPFCRIKTKKCIKCYNCIRSCPDNAMFLNKKGKIRINNQCSMCMRCTMYCPKDAIHFGFMNAWRVNKPYDYKKIMQNSAISDSYVNKNTKGYFKHFRKYFAAQDSLLAAYGVSLKKDIN
jgi:ferredoxin/flavodoxin